MTTLLDPTAGEFVDEAVYLYIIYRWYSSIHPYLLSGTDERVQSVLRAQQAAAVAARREEAATTSCRVLW